MSNADLAIAARTATQIDLADAATDDALKVAAYQAANREGRTYYFVQTIGLGFGAYTSMDDFHTASAPYRQDATGTPIAHKRFEADGTIVEVKADGTEKEPRAGFLAGMAEDIADADRIAAIAKSLVR